MTRRSLIVLVVTIAAALGFAALGAFAFSGSRHGSWGYGHGMMNGYRTSGSAVLMIRHQREHCHAWSLNGSAFKAAQSSTLKAGSLLTVVNGDVMPHRLVKLSGPAVTMRNGTLMPMMGGGYVSQTPGLMSHMGARTTVTFDEPGVYRFKTRAGEDYMPGIETTGEDNVLTLTVTVTG